jgi:hypothetical protein
MTPRDAGDECAKMQEIQRCVGRRGGEQDALAVSRAADQRRIRCRGCQAAKDWEDLRRPPFDAPWVSRTRRIAALRVVAVLTGTRNCSWRRAVPSRQMQRRGKSVEDPGSCRIRLDGHSAAVLAHRSVNRQHKDAREADATAVVSFFDASVQKTMNDRGRGVEREGAPQALMICG